MTNYSERLDEIMSKLARDTTLADRAADIATTPSAVNDASKRYQWSLGDAKQAIASLIKELVAEAKPEVKAHPLGPVTLADCQRGLDHYEANLLKALEEN